MATIRTAMLRMVVIGLLAAVCCGCYPAAKVVAVTSGTGPVKNGHGFAVSGGGLLSGVAESVSLDLRDGAKIRQRRFYARAAVPFAFTDGFVATIAPVVGIASTSGSDGWDADSGVLFGGEVTLVIGDIEGPPYGEEIGMFMFLNVRRLRTDCDLRRAGESFDSVRTTELAFGLGVSF